MKKTLIIASLLTFVVSTAVFATENATPKSTTKTTVNAPNEMRKPPKGPDFAKRNAEFEKRLKLTEEQKQQAEQIRKKGFEQIKPIMIKIKEKKQEIEMVKRSKIHEIAQNEQIEQLNKEIGALKKEAHRLRMENMKEFEGILTNKQQKELKKIKKEGRKKFEEALKKNPNKKIGSEIPKENK